MAGKDPPSAAGYDGKWSPALGGKGVWRKGGGRGVRTTTPRVHRGGWAGNSAVGRWRGGAALPQDGAGGGGRRTGRTGSTGGRYRGLSGPSALSWPSWEGFLRDR